MTFPLDSTHDPDLRSWVEGADDHSDFPIQNLPLGMFSPEDRSPRAAMAIGDYVLDLVAAADAGLIGGDAARIVRETGEQLNLLLAAGAPVRVELRQQVSRLLAVGSEHEAAARACLFAHTDVTMHLPAQIGDYTDFYVGVHHATNIGKLFRPDNPLLPNYKHVPIGYHGRASSIRPSGAPLKRPVGQQKGEEGPVFGPSKRLDYELEMGVWISQGNALGDPIDIASASEHIAGLSLFNDWSARDIQAWEYQPLGPFLSKSFLSTVSPWIVTAEALAPFRIAQPARPEGDPAPLPYLIDETDQASGAFAITLEVYLSSAKMRNQGLTDLKLSSGPASNMYWTVAQMVTHHTVNGCNLLPGDLLGTGTISAPDRSGYGSLMELSSGGKEPIDLPGGETRTFLEDGDRISLRGTLSAPGFRSIGFGACVGDVTPAREY
ncbi:fumarylacetoacetase [Qipengyuania sp. GH25]|uniref:fumarylacetoacetase n=1 Tax=Qipengyuania pacifica TaxID=2860199 RepID=A0ABS7JDA4_9SPHN|nr:fumarylacetoacetase [Qipengyuania aerophila]MBX7487916.1 fumarylacetoacetase [Qipengyuania aerophila]